MVECRADEDAGDRAVLLFLNLTPLASNETTVSPASAANAVCVNKLATTANAAARKTKPRRSNIIDSARHISLLLRGSGCAFPAWLARLASTIDHPIHRTDRLQPAHRQDDAAKRAGSVPRVYADVGNSISVFGSQRLSGGFARGKIPFSFARAIIDGSRRGQPRAMVVRPRATARRSSNEECQACLYW